MTKTPERSGPAPGAGPSLDPAAADRTAPVPDPALDAAYRATTYRAVCEEVSGGRLDIRIDARHPLLDAWLDRVGVACWSYLSAENPGSGVLSPADNAARTTRLRQVLEASGKPFLAGQAVADDGRWPAEASFLVGGLGEAEAVALAAACEQNAVVCGRRGQIARLVWLRARS